MRSLVVTTWFPSAGNPGSGIFNLHDVKMLAQNHTVTVLHLCLGDTVAADTIPEGVQVLRMPLRWRNPLSILRAARRIARLAKQHDLVHTLAFPALIPARLAMFSKPWVHTEHWSRLAIVPGRGMKGRAEAILRRLLRSPQFVIAVSDGLARNIAQIRGNTATLRVVYNHVPTPPDGVIAQKWQSGEPLRLCAIGGLIPRKGAKIAVAALHELVSRGYDAQLEWIGEGPERDDVIKLARELGVLEKLTLPGFVPPEKIWQHLVKNSIFILPTVQETFGVAVAEALVCGLPVVVTGHGGHTEFLEPRYGVVCDRTPEAVAAGIEKMIDNPDVLHSLDISAIARKRFSDLDRLIAYGEVYSQAAGE